MNNVKVYINSTTQDTREKWGVFFIDTSVTVLMAPPPRKSYITNKSALSDGKQVLTASGALPKTDERDISLSFGLSAKSLSQFLMRYRAFTDELKKGVIDLTLHVWEGGTFFKETYHLVYLSCSQYSEFNGRLAKFVLKLNEPNPENRTLEHSTDITL